MSFFHRAAQRMERIRSMFLNISFKDWIKVLEMQGTPLHGPPREHNVLGVENDTIKMDAMKKAVDEAKEILAKQQAVINQEHTLLYQQLKSLSSLQTALDKLERLCGYASKHLERMGKDIQSESKPIQFEGTTMNISRSFEEIIKSLQECHDLFSKSNKDHTLLSAKEHELEKVGS